MKKENTQITQITELKVDKIYPDRKNLIIRTLCH